MMKIVSAVFQAGQNTHEKRIEQLREFLDQFEQKTVPMIRMESDRELILRAKDYLRRFKGQPGVRLNMNLLDSIERLVEEIEKSSMII